MPTIINDSSERRAITFSIPGQLVGLNKYIAAERGNRFAAANLKKKTQALICEVLQYQARAVFEGPVFIEYHWIEPNQRRDLDNIAFAKKFIQDALVESGVLENDGWKHIVGFNDRFSVDKANPRIEVTIMLASQEYEIPVDS